MENKPPRQNIDSILEHHKNNTSWIAGSLCEEILALRSELAAINPNATSTLDCPLCKAQDWTVCHCGELDYDEEIKALRKMVKDLESQLGKEWSKAQTEFHVELIEARDERDDARSKLTDRDKIILGLREKIMWIGAQCPDLDTEKAIRELLELATTTIAEDVLARERAKGIRSIRVVCDDDDCHCRQVMEGAESLAKAEEARIQSRKEGT